MTDNKNAANKEIVITENNNNNNHSNNPSSSLPKLKIRTNNEITTLTGIHEPRKLAKKKRRDKSDLGDNFVAPDGGWGWVVTVASGISVLVTFALAQQFGIIFRDHMFQLGITTSQLTTIINTQIAISSVSGLLNGPLFRRYTYRQVALCGATLIFLGLFSSVFAKSFMFYILSYSFLYGLGRGFMVSSSSMAVNTYFKQKRRAATAYQFGVAGMGPIICPYLATFLLEYLGVQGTVLIFSGLSLHNIASSLIFQPVIWHVRKVAKDAEALNAPAASAIDEEEQEIEQFAEPETPILPRANDGWFGSRTSLNILTHRNRQGSLDKHSESGTPIHEMRRLSFSDGVSRKPRTFSITHSIKEEEQVSDFQQDEHEKEGVDKALKDATGKHATYPLTTEEFEKELEEEEVKRQKLPFYQKVIIFFDLDLLRDFTYVNLAAGLTVIIFVEVNFAILTPFILSDFGYNSGQIAMAMSLLGLFDLVIRFLIPLMTAKIKLSNKTLFIIGIMGMCIGRVFLSFTRDFTFLIMVFIWLGLFKAFRTVFCLLIIPGYVPLKRLPAATGLQLLMSGIFSMVFGPLIGLIRDRTNYTFTLNFLNGMCILAIIVWVLDDYIKKHRNKPHPTPTNADTN